MKISKKKDYAVVSTRIELDVFDVLKIAEFAEILTATTDAMPTRDGELEECVIMPKQHYDQILQMLSNLSGGISFVNKPSLFDKLVEDTEC